MPNLNLDRPAPQADRLTVVAAVVDAIAEGCVTADAIADAIGMSGRQGAYYPNAAWTLGYAEPDATTVPRQWRLTAHGEAFTAMSPTERASDLTTTLCSLEELGLFTADSEGPRALGEEWAAAGYSDQTVERRLQTVEAWGQFLLTDLDEQAEALAAASTATRRRAPAACAADEQRRREAIARAALTPAARPVERAGKVCPRCFVTMPLTGVCPDCD